MSEHHDDNQYFEEQHSGLLSTPMPFALGLVFMIAAGGSWWYFSGSSDLDQDQPIPLVAADITPIKVAAETSEQPEVPHQDKLVYSRVNPAEATDAIERLLPPSEDVFNPEIIVSEAEKLEDAPTRDVHTDITEIKSESFETKIAEAPVDQPAEAPQEEVFPAISKASEEAYTTTSAVVPKEVLKAIETPVEKKVEEKAPVKSKSLKSGYRVQLASLKSPQKAKHEWNRLKGEYKGALGNFNARFARVDLGAKKGIYYRVQVGDFASKEEAQNVCKNMKAKNAKAGCLVVRF